MTILEKLPDAEPVIPAAELIQTGPVSIDKSSEIVVETPMPDLFDDTTVPKTEDASTSKRTQVWPKLKIFLLTNFDFKNPQKNSGKTVSVYMYNSMTCNWLLLSRLLSYNVPYRSTENLILFFWIY